jgi:TP901-1 family phage major tail protein
MTAQRGKDLLLKVADGAGGYVTVAGLRSRALTFDAATVDVTDAESAGGWRELLAGAGIRRASISGSGVFRDGSSDAQMRAIFFNNEIRAWQIVIPGFGTVQGPFQIAALGYRGEHAGEVGFDLTLDSAGELTFAAS